MEVDTPTPSVHANMLHMCAHAHAISAYACMYIYVCMHDAHACYACMYALYAYVHMHASCLIAGEGDGKMNWNKLIRLLVVVISLQSLCILMYSCLSTTISVHFHAYPLTISVHFHAFMPLHHHVCLSTAISMHFHIFIPRHLHI